MIWIIILEFIIVHMVLLPPESCAPLIKHNKPHKNTPPRSSLSKRQGSVNIGLNVKIPPEGANDTLKKIEQELAKVIGKGMEGESPEEVEKNPQNETVEQKKWLIKPAFQCDDWDLKTRTCWLERNVGDTVTFSLSTGVVGRHGRPDVVWKRELAQRDSKAFKEYVIDPGKPSRNLVIGRRGYELRVSPITELDVGDNLFSAALSKGVPSKLNFQIRIMAEDLGFVYIGETLDLSIESYVTLPLESVSFHWYSEEEGESASLPSNMRVSQAGETLRVSELRQEQEGVLACSVYTNRNVHATKKRFLIKELTRNKDVLKSFADHNITYYEEKGKHRRKAMAYRGKRGTRGRSKESKLRKKSASKKKKTGREINKANFEGEQYTIVKPDQEDTLQINARQYPVDEGIYSKVRDGGQEDIGMSFGNTSDTETQLNFDVGRVSNVEEDGLSQLVSYCVKDMECSKHATCVRTSLKDQGFCRCLPGFYGPGIFCREEM